MTDFITINTRELGELTGIGTPTVRAWLCNYKLAKYVEGDRFLTVQLTPGFVKAWAKYIHLRHYDPDAFKKRVQKMYENVSE